MSVEIAPAASGAPVSRWKPYTTYKDSGVEWLGKIPVDWEVRNLKWNLEFLNSQRIPLSSEQRANMEKIYPYYGASGIIDYVDDYLFDEDLILIAEDGANLFSRSTHLAFLAKGKYWVNNHAHILKPKNGCLNFWMYSLESFVFDPYISGSAQPKLNKENLGIIKFATPLKMEQHAIAAFLDRKTSRIDTLISKKERLITLLQEKRAALISHTVTKGLDPDVPMKDSGVEWLGEIPAHWVSVAIKHLLEVKDGTHDTPQFVSPSDNTFQLITSKDIKDGQLVFEEAKHISQDDYETIIKRSNVMTNDVIMPMIGTIGNPVVIGDYNLFAIKNVALFKTCIGNLNSRYLCYFLISNACQTQFKLLYRGGVQDFVSLSVLRNLIVFQMANGEDNLIANYLDNKTSKIDALIFKIQEAIKTLQEYRTALISAAVTGKIDVRNENCN